MTSSTDAVSTPATSNPLPPSSGLTEKLFEELLTELRTERSNMREQHHELGQRTQERATVEDLFSVGSDRNPAAGHHRVCHLLHLRHGIPVGTVR